MGTIRAGGTSKLWVHYAVLTLQTYEDSVS